MSEPALRSCDELPVPEGFVLREIGGPYFTALGPIYMKPTPQGGAVIALRVAHQHTNMAGMTHGGMLATLADGAFGINIAMLRKRRSGQVTVSLNADYLSPARPGDWLEAHVTVRRMGWQLAFADCLLQVGERLVLRATAVFSFVAASGTARPDAKDG
ncbi:PaaI family thioesterase [Aquabacterium sp.]|uniref:PaaI family thioesterase n=1 Tax=Aquabacterium sp. TaxID=1872578 RepID=UPI002CF651A8|nr:PaaI family thioesterase [Aquabacterium sp.]HSW06618.1 PaaI family thioesterase [Aquabacterium sp.]